MKIFDLVLVWREFSFTFHDFNGGSILTCCEENLTLFIRYDATVTFLHIIKMNGVLSSGEMIFGHQISCLVLIHHTCKTDEDQGQLSQMIEKDRREVIALLLDLLQVGQ